MNRAMRSSPPRRRSARFPIDALRMLRGKSFCQPGLEPLERRDCPAVMFTIQPPPSIIYEGDTAVFTVRLREASTQPERVAVTVASGTAVLGQDFLFSNSTQLLFAPGQLVKRFSVRTFADTQREAGETFIITASSLTSPDATPATRLGRIFDLIPSTLRAEGARVVEGNSGTVNAEFTVRLEGSPTAPVSVNYVTSDVTATAGSDYTATSGVLTFAVGETVKKISVPVTGDTDAEVDETFRLNFLNPSRGMTIATPFVTGTIANDEPDQVGFQIDVEYVSSGYGDVPIGVRNAMQLAVQRWQQVITGDVAGFTEATTNQFIDDFRIRVQMGLLSDGTDGVGSTLANARPLEYRTGGAGLPWLGETGIDPADVGNAQLVPLLIHELGHALGFASSNPNFTRWVSGATWTGPNAVREYSILAGTSMTSIPLETEGGEGTAGAHWSEDIFNTELMTGYAEPFGVAMPLSRLTIGAFADLGYTVNYAMADPYIVPVAATSTSSAPQMPPSSRPGALPQPLTDGPTPPTKPIPVKTSLQPSAETTPPPAPRSGIGGSKLAAMPEAIDASAEKPMANFVRASAFSALALR